MDRELFQYEILMNDARKAKDEGFPQQALDLAGMATSEATKEFGKYSLQSFNCVIFMAETSFAVYRSISKGMGSFEDIGMEDEFKKSFLINASQYHDIASQIIKNSEKKDPCFSMLCDCLGANIYHSDKENILGSHFGYTLEDTKNVAKRLFADSLVKGALILKDIEQEYCHDVVQTMVMDSYFALKKELGVKFEKEHFILERCFKKDNEYLRAYLNVDTNEIFFNGEDVCRHHGITQEEAEKIIPKGEITSSDKIGFFI